MSYSITQAKQERALDIAYAMKGVDAPDKLIELATQVKKEGEDELAEYLINTATRMEFAYDAANDN